jgi:predicted Zn-dependent peptidase
VLDEHLVQAADVIADIVFRPLLRSSDLALERKVVLEEISMVEDTPDDLVFELHNETLWGAHPYGYSILGTRDTVSRLGVRALKELHGRAYHPPQLVVAAAGNVEHARLLEALHSTGWTEVSRGREDLLGSPDAATERPKIRHVEREGPQTHVVIGTSALPYADPARYALVMVSMLLGGGMSSRLFQRVREELALAYSIYTFQQFYANTGVHGVYVATSPETARAAYDAIRQELEQVARNGLPEAEIAMGKSQLKGQVTLSLESVGARMYRAAAVELYGEPYRSLDETLALIDGVTVDDIAAIARRFFAPDEQTVLSLGPAPLL